MPFFRFVMRRAGALSFILWLFLLIYYEKSVLTVSTLLGTLVHEMGHLFAFRLIGEPTPRFSFKKLGLCLTPRRMLSYRDEAIVALFGPLCNLILSLLLLPFQSHQKYVKTFCAVNLLLAGVHFLPVLPLDGGRVAGALARQLLDDRAGERFARIISHATLAAVLFFSLYFMLFYGTAFPLFLTCIFLFREQSSFEN